MTVETVRESAMGKLILPEIGHMLKQIGPMRP